MKAKTKIILMILFILSNLKYSFETIPATFQECNALAFCTTILIKTMERYLSLLRVFLQLLYLRNAPGYHIVKELLYRRYLVNHAGDLPHHQGTPL